MYQHCIKRIFDFILVFCTLAIIWPIFLIITLWLYFANRGAGVFFLQNRPGKKGKFFKVIKYKTMTDERDENGNLLPDEKRLTKIGKFIRSTSIDELPQLINVLKGDMALIGPLYFPNTFLFIPKNRPVVMQSGQALQVGHR